RSASTSDQASSNSTSARSAHSPAKRSRAPRGALPLAPDTPPTPDVAARPEPCPLSGRSARERIDDQVHAELRRVLLHRPLRLGVEVPLRAVVLVAVEQADPVPPAIPAARPDEDRMQVRVQQVVAPAVQLVVRVRWAVLEREEATVDLVVVRHLLQLPAEQTLDLLRRRLVEDARDVVVVVVHHHETTTLHVALQVPPLRLREAYRQMARQPHERVVEQLLRVQPYVHSRRRHLDRRVARHRVDQVLRQRRRALPVPGGVLGRRKDEPAHGIPPHSSGPRSRTGTGSSARRTRASALSAAAPRPSCSIASASASATTGASTSAATRT